MSKLSEENLLTRKEIELQNFINLSEMILKLSEEKKELKLKIVDLEKQVRELREENGKLKITMTGLFEST